MPVPPMGVACEVNNDVILLFDNQEQATAYADELKQLPGSQKKVGKEVINAIDNDLLVK